MSVISLLVIIIFVVTSVLTIVSIALHRKKIANILNIFVIIFSCISILASGIFALIPFVGGTIDVFYNSPTPTASGSIPVSSTSIYNDQLRHLNNLGKTDISFILADVCDINGDEAICCYKDGSDYIIDVYGIKNGTLVTIISKNGADGSVYLLELNGKSYILEYTQDISTSNYTQHYSYKLSRYDSNFEPIIENQNSISISSGEQGGGSKASKFFTALNSYLVDAKICYDGYKLKGYETSNYYNDYSNYEGYDNYDNSNNKYLNITNCDTGKLGVVNIKDAKSWLNLRSGPSTKHDKILIDPTNKKSMVKQAKHSLVTVIEPYNTNDKKNPVWYKVQISYNNQIFEGYSSQKYIEVENMTKIKKGDIFNVSISTNDTGAYFTSNDPSVATIDSDSGAIRANKKGIVLITVTTYSGLQDSCLIEIV